MACHIHRANETQILELALALLFSVVMHEMSNEL
jgi:hypothetical protein